MRLVSECGLFSAWVEVDGMEKPVYDGKRLEGRDKRMEGYFASETGKIYVVRVDTSRYGSSAKRYNSAYRDLTATLYIDGNEISSAATNFDLSLSTGEKCWEGMAVGPGLRQSFVFSRPVLTESATPITEAAAQSLGTIRIVFQRMSRCGDAYDAAVMTTTVPKPTREIAEGSKKMLSNITEFGQTKKAERERYIRVNYHPADTVEDPLECLVLKYAEEGVLKARGIIPKIAAELAEEEEAVAKDKTPIDLEEKQHNSAGTSEDEDEEEEEEDAEAARKEEEALRARLAEIEAKNAASQAKKRKRAETDSQEDDKSGVLRKAEREMTKKLKKAKERDDGVVDLTVDD